jgi:hypothetical protein
MDNEYEDPLPEVWEMFLRLISDSDKEYKFLYKIVANQILRIVSNMKQLYEENNFGQKPLDPINENDEYPTQEVRRYLTCSNNCEEYSRIRDQRRTSKRDKKS